MTVLRASLWESCALVDQNCLSAFLSSGVVPFCGNSHTGLLCDSESVAAAEGGVTAKGHVVQDKGAGPPLVSHETWPPQIRHHSRRHSHHRFFTCSLEAEGIIPLFHILTDEM